MAGEDVRVVDHLDVHYLEGRIVVDDPSVFALLAMVGAVGFGRTSSEIRGSRGGKGSLTEAERRDGN